MLQSQQFLHNFESLLESEMRLKTLFVFQMEIDKTKWSCSWNSVEIRLSYQLDLHIHIMLCLKGRVPRLGKTECKTLPGVLKHGA